jgi:hypothetical protein
LAVPEFAGVGLLYPEADVFVPLLRTTLAIVDPSLFVSI